MANIEERLVELINLASIEMDVNKKVEYLYQIKELTLNHNGLIDNFFENVLAFQNERAPQVKKFILAFIESACKLNCQLCPKAVISLNLLLNDTNSDIVKRSIQAATQFYRSLVQWIVSISPTTSTLATTPSINSIASGTSNNMMSTTAVLIKSEGGTNQSPTPAGVIPMMINYNNSLSTANSNMATGGEVGIGRSYTGDIGNTWLMWLQIRNSICSLLETTNNDGIRTHCIKFIETMILLQTPRDKYTDSNYELNLIDPMINPILLSEEALLCGVIGLPKNGILFNQEHKLEMVDASKKRFEQLVVFHGTSHISSVNLMAATQSLVVLAKQRYRLFMGRVIQAMESLNTRLPPTLTESQVQSVKKFMKLQLTVMLKHPYSLDHFQSQITQLLQAVGSRQPEIHKVINEFKHRFGSESQANINNNANANLDIQKRIKLDQDLRQHSQSVPMSKSKQLDLNKLTQELDEKEKRQIVVESVKRILSEEKNVYIPPVQMDIKKKVLSTLANEFHNTECPDIIQDYIFADLRNRHDLGYAIIRKNYDVAALKAAKRQVNLFDNQELLKKYFESFNSYLNRAMELKDSKEKELILPKLYALRNEYYAASNQDQDPELEQALDQQDHQQ